MIGYAHSCTYAHEDGGCLCCAFLPVIAYAHADAYIQVSWGAARSQQRVAGGVHLPAGALAPSGMIAQSSPTLGQSADEARGRARTLPSVVSWMPPGGSSLRTRRAGGQRMDTLLEFIWQELDARRKAAEGWLQVGRSCLPSVEHAWHIAVDGDAGWGTRLRDGFQRSDRTWHSLPSVVTWAGRSSACGKESHSGVLRCDELATRWSSMPSVVGSVYPVVMHDWLCTFLHVCA